MPFTLAHPAAVLPFKRFCPRFFSFPALVVGSLSPDAGYCFGTLNADDFAHTFKGSIEFCLPVGVVLLGLYYALRRPVVGMLPGRFREYFQPLCRPPIGSPLTAILSLLLGIWIHLLLDSLTHKNGWLAENLPGFQVPVFSAAGHDFRIVNLLWYVLSFAGIVWLYMAWQQERNNRAGAVPPAAGRGKVLVEAVLAGVLMVPIELAHHLVGGRAGLLLIAGYGALIILGAAWRIGRKSPANR